MLPLLAGYAPLFALVIGSAVADHGQPVAGWAGSWIIFGGARQLAAIRTLDEAGAVAAILTALLIHARLVVYSTSMAQHWAGQPRWFRVTAAALIIDPTWAVAEQHAATSTDARDAAALLLRRRGPPWARLVGRHGRRHPARRPPGLARPPDRGAAVPARDRRRKPSDGRDPSRDRRRGVDGIPHVRLAVRHGPAGGRRGRVLLGVANDRRRGR